MNITTHPTNAAHNLLGRILSTGWKVTEKFSKAEYNSGAFFSVCYKVQKEGEICFLKAFDFAKFFSNVNGTKSVMDVMGDMITAYKYERDLSTLCKNSKVTKVAFVKDAGEELIEGYQISIVPYLIFELAEGDLRKTMALSENLDDAWRLVSLHSVAVGLHQLHKIKVCHLDIKPSNVLVFKEESKIGDIGRSVSDDISSPYDDMIYSGDIDYAPPEIIYGFFNKQKRERNFATDCYLLGNLIVFYFTGVSMNFIMAKYIPPNLMHYEWSGSFDEIKEYLLDAFTKALDELQECIKNKQLGHELVVLVKQLCYPTPELRGHAKNLGAAFDQFGLERFISNLDLLRRKVEFEVLK